MTELWRDPEAEGLLDGAFEIRCRGCKRVLAPRMRALTPETPVRFGDEQPLLPEGILALPERLPDAPMRRCVRDLLAERRGGYYVDGESLTGIVRTSEHFGCCGTTSLEGPNIECECGQGVGAEDNDCIDPNYVWLYSNRVEFTLPGWVVQGPRGALG